MQTNWIFDNLINNFTVFYRLYIIKTKLEDHIRKDIEDKLEVRCRLPDLQNYLSEKYDFDCNLKFLRNLKYKIKANTCSGDNSLSEFVKDLQDKHGNYTLNFEINFYTTTSLNNCMKLSKNCLLYRSFSRNFSR